MATQDVAVRPQQDAVRRDTSEIAEIQRIGNVLAASGYFADAREMAQAAVKVMAGRELGIPPVASMMGIYIVKSRIVMSANLIASRVKAHGFDYRHTRFDSTGCVLTFYGRPGPDGKRDTLGVSSFTDEDAKAAGLLANETYKKYPRNMFFARAISNGARWYTPEVFAGAPVYTPNEMGVREDEQGEIIAEAPAITPTAAQAQVAQSKIAEMKAGAAYAEMGMDAPDEIAAASIKARLEQFAKMRATLGDDDYYRVINGHGFEHANEIKSLNQARAIYKELLETQKSKEHAMKEAEAAQWEQPS